MLGCPVIELAPSRSFSYRVRVRGPHNACKFRERVLHNCAPHSNSYHPFSPEGKTFPFVPKSKHE